MNDISIWYILDIISKRIWAILLAAAVVTGATYIYEANFVTPEYTATSSIIASNGGIVSYDQSTKNPEEKIGSSDLASSLNIIDTYIDVLNTNGFFFYLADLPEIKSYGFSAYDIKDNIHIKRRSDTSLFIDIDYSYTDAHTSIEMSNIIGATAPTYINTMIKDAYVVLADRSVSATRTSPKELRDSLLMGFVTLFLMMALFVFLAAADNTVKGEEDIQKKYNLPVLGIVPDFEIKSSKPKKGGTKVAG